MDEKTLIFLIKLKEKEKIKKKMLKAKECQTVRTPVDKK